jgi:hypothetical protein
MFQNTRTPLTVWFWAAYLMTTDKRGVSALLLQRQLGLPRYETAWMMLHKLRRAMVSLAREPLWGEVEVDETWVGGTQAGLRGSRQLKGRKAALVLVAVEKRGRGTGRIRMAVIPDFKRITLTGYHGVSRNQLQAYLDEFVFRHNRRRTPMAAFQTLLGLGTGRTCTPYEAIRAAKDLLKLSTEAQLQ